ncbi:MAG: amidase family protein [Desulfobacterales bacterium]
MTTDTFVHRPSAPDAPVSGGPLSGLSVIIQPDLSVRDWPTDAGSKALAGFCAVFDATLISRLKGAGASIAGSAPMAELGFGINGSALARILASDDAARGLMTDTWRNPHRGLPCRTLGVKPTWGLLSRYGLTGLIPSMEGTGILAKHPADIAKMMAAMAGPDDNDGSMCVEPPLIFLYRQTPNIQTGNHFTSAFLKTCRHFLKQLWQKPFPQTGMPSPAADLRSKKWNFPDLQLICFHPSDHCRGGSLLVRRKI